MNEIDSSNPNAEQALNRSKPSTTEELFHTMVHELRTPIAVISGYATLLANDKLKNLHPEAIESILRASKKLEILLKDAVDDYRNLTEKPDTTPAAPDSSL